MSGFIVILVAWMAVLPDGDGPPDGSWRFVLPAADDPFEHPPLRALGLTRQKPEDVIERAAYRGLGRRYARVAFGHPGSVRITVVLDDLGAGRADLYVDADRNCRIDARDRVTPGPDGRTWRVPLDVAIATRETTRFDQREYLFRLGSSGVILSGAAAGYLEGTVRVGGREHRVRRTDGDGNGRVTDPLDGIWVDLNDDRRWDPADEQFLHAPILTLAGGRYAVRSDEYGQRLALERLGGTGTVRLALAKPGMSMAELTATLVGRDGSVVGLAGVGGKAEVPVGDYRLGTVTLSLENPAGGPSWGYVFSDSSRRGEPVWHQVQRGETAAIDPLGAIALETGLDSVKPRKPGDDLSVRPGLFTGDGLRIVTCYRGAPTSPGSDDGPCAEITLSDREHGTLATARSGFACGTFCQASVQVPLVPPPGCLQLSVVFDSGPLAGRLHATSNLDIDSTPGTR